MIHMPNSDPMDQDDIYADPPPQETQQTQSTQQASQVVDNGTNAHIWGFLLPCKDIHSRIDFWKTVPTQYIGRGGENNVQLPSLRISNKHCIITWDGKEDESSLITILDLSSNGTYINGAKIGKNQTAILREGNEIALGAVGATNPADDFRYIFRFTAQGPPLDGVHRYYDIGSELGKGTFATVMKAVCRETGHVYAVKMIHRSRFRPKGKESEDIFMREIRITEQLNHPNICRMKESFIDNVTIYLVLEFVGGGDLLDYILRSGGLIAEDSAQQLTYQLCDALAYIHAQGIAHRDLKPENVLLTADVPPRVKVADFGLAKAVDSMTMFKTTCGTPSYLAPEVVLRAPDEAYDHLVDSWSVGVVVYGMMANASPFPYFEDDKEASLRDRFEQRYTDWRTLRACGISSLGFGFVERLLEVDPRKRMSVTEALEHPWLALYRAQALAAAPPHNPPITVPSLAVPPAPPARGPRDLTFEQISMADAHVPGEFPQSQPLGRRADALNAQDPDGRLQSWELVAPAAGGDGGPVAGPSHVPANGAHAADGGSSDSSLTPVSEEDGGTDDAHAPARGARPARAGEKRKARGKARPAAGGGIGKRTRAAVAAAREDDEMEVEAPPARARPVRQSARNQGSPPKRNAA